MPPTLVNSLGMELIFLTMTVPLGEPSVFHRLPPDPKYRLPLIVTPLPSSDTSRPEFGTIVVSDADNISRPSSCSTVRGDQRRLGWDFDLPLIQEGSERVQGFIGDS